MQQLLVQPLLQQIAGKRLQLLRAHAGGTGQLLQRRLPGCRLGLQQLQQMRAQGVELGKRTISCWSR